MIHQNLNMIWGYTWIILRFKTLYMVPHGTRTTEVLVPTAETTSGRGEEGHGTLDGESWDRVRFMGKQNSDLCFCKHVAAAPVYGKRWYLGARLPALSLLMHGRTDGRRRACLSPNMEAAWSMRGGQACEL